MFANIDNSVTILEIKEGITLLSQELFIGYIINVMKQTLLMQIKIEWSFRN